MQPDSKKILNPISTAVSKGGQFKKLHGAMRILTTALKFGSSGHVFSNLMKKN